MMFTKFIPKPIQKFLMIDVYKEASKEDREFLDILLFVAKMIYSLRNPISLMGFLITTALQYV